ncbi:MAG: caspase family protein [Coleofasciculaceae cyanobacterium]
MSQIKRRQFLQFSGSLLATLGISQLDFIRTGDRYGRVLAQDTRRKLALLVGINQYKSSPLQGCVTDVFLQKQLLIHRFGFNPKDILMLTDQQATRQGILTAFEEHLIKQGRENDVVVFHYSGHGSQVQDPDCDEPDCLNSTFVPIDSVLPTDYPRQGGTVRDITGHTLFLLMNALKSENVTAVLDSCYSGGGTRGNFAVRARSGGSTLKPIAAEQAYQQQWLEKLNLSPAEFKQKRRRGVAKGVVVASTRRDQLAADAPFNDFFAGAFTYLMTQYLWQQTGSQSFASVMPNVARSTTRLSFTGQVPKAEEKPNSNYLKSPVYFIEKQTPPAEAVITEVEGNQAQLWLGGLDPESLAAFNQGAILSVVDPQSREIGRVKLQSRRGLVARAVLLDSAQPGSFLQERVRSIPNNLTLKIGLDSSLADNISLARQALANIEHIEALPLHQQEVQYIFGSMTDEYRQQLRSNSGSELPKVGSLGLFSPAQELIPDSFGAVGENVNEAIRRLRPKLKSLLAAHIIKTALNTNSSRLNILVSMHPEGAREVLATAFTVRGRGLAQGNRATPTRPVVGSNSRKLPVGTPVQLKVINQESNDLYLSILVIDPTGEISVIFPNQWTVAEEVTLLGSGQTLQIPKSTDSFTLVTQEPKGITEVLIIASQKPLRKALQTLRTVASTRGMRGGPVILEASEQLNEPTQVIDNLLDDINNGTRGSVSNATSSSRTVHNLDTTQLAALSISFEVI